MRFTIRDLLWLTVVVALGVAWWLDRRTLIAISDLSQRKFVALERLIRQAGHDVEYDGEMPAQVKMFMHLRDVPKSSAPAPNLTSE